MAFRIVENPGRTLWMASDGSSTYYIGQLVSLTAAGGGTETNGAVVPLAVPAGAADATNMQIPFGVVVAFNNRTPTSNATGDYQIGVVSSANQKLRDWCGQEGMYAKGDPQLLIQVEEIHQLSVLRGNIYNSTNGTVCKLNTVSASTDADGMISANVTTDAIPFTNVALCGTHYFRTGTNAGLYRVSKNTSTTAPTVTTAFPNNVAVGDTLVSVPLKQGNSNIYIAGPGLFIDQSKTPTIAGTTLFNVFVYELNLETAYAETADFRFGGDHFCRFRA